MSETNLVNLANYARFLRDGNTDEMGWQEKYQKLITVRDELRGRGAEIGWRVNTQKGWESNARGLACAIIEYVQREQARQAKAARQ